jgi:hypothetical protein
LISALSPCINLFIAYFVRADKMLLPFTRGQITCYCPRKMLLPRWKITRRKLCFYYTCKLSVISIQYVINVYIKFPSWRGSNPTDGDVYSIHLYVMKLVSELRQICVFFPCTLVSSTNKIDRYVVNSWNIVETGMKHHYSNPSPSSRKSLWTKII